MGTEQIEYISLRNDLLFHMVFTRNLAALKALLAALLGLAEARIDQIEVLNPMQYSEAASSKLTVLDLYDGVDPVFWMDLEAMVPPA